MSILLLLLACSADDDGGVKESNPVGTDDSSAVDDTEPPEPEYGCAEGRVTLGETTCAAEASCVWTGSQNYEYFGVSLDAGDDLDGDGRPDILAGGPGLKYTDAEGTVFSNAGHVGFISGASIDEPDAGGFSADMRGDTELEFLGSAVALLGDVNGDGIGDALIGAMGDDSAGDDAGAVHLIFGVDGGWGGAEFFEGDHVWTGETETGRAGYAASRAGDTNGDGLMDFWATGSIKQVVSDNESFARGRVYWNAGTADGFTSGSLASSDAVFEGYLTNEGAGNDIGAGDFDGDGYADAAIGAPYGGSYKGTVYLLKGSAEGFSGESGLDGSPAVEGEGVYDAFGWRVAVGDFTGDGFDDLAVGAPLNDQVGGSGGKLYLYAGAADVFEGGAVPLGDYLGETDDAQLGSGVASGGDVDNDGDDELVVGAVAQWQWLVTKGGRAYVLDGGSAWTSGGNIADAVQSQVYGNTVKDYIGAELGFGDFDGDGHSDLVVSSGYVNLSGSYDLGSVYLFFGK